MAARRRLASFLDWGGRFFVAKALASGLGGLALGWWGWARTQMAAPVAALLGLAGALGIVLLLSAGIALSRQLRARPTQQLLSLAHDLRQLAIAVTAWIAGPPWGGDYSWKDADDVAEWNRQHMKRCNDSFDEQFRANLTRLYDDASRRGFSKTELEDVIATGLTPYNIRDVPTHLRRLADGIALEAKRRERRSHRA